METQKKGFLIILYADGFMVSDLIFAFIDGYGL